MNELKFVEFYLAKLENEPKKAELMEQLAFSYLSKNTDHESSLHWFTEAVEFDPSIENLTNLGWFLIEEYGTNTNKVKLTRTRKYKLATEALKQAIQQEPKIETPYFVLAVAYYFQDNYDKAEENLRKAVMIQPNYFNQNLLGLLLFKKGRFEEASKYFYDAYYSQEDDFEMTEAYYSYGMCLEKLDRYEEAQAVSEILFPNDEMTFGDIESDGVLIFDQEEPDLVLRCCFINCPIC